jgi:serine/threonine protein kinase
MVRGAVIAQRIWLMHGLILVQLQKFAQQTIGADRWREALTRSGLQRSFSAGSVYEDVHAMELVALASETLDMPVDQVVESFGRFLSTELTRLYQRVIKPEWRTLDIIEHTETFIHSSVRVGNPGAVPPVLDAVRFSENELQLLYSSERKLCKLAIGIIKGLADHYHDIIEIHEDSCMLRGDAFCSFRVIRKPERRDTEKVELDNPVHVDLNQDFSVDGLKTPTGSLKTISSGYENSEPVRWDVYLSPPMFESDFGSIGPYRLLTQHGEGGMGCVFHAIDIRTEQTVALKILHPKIAQDETATKRFLRELKALQLIKSPHVVAVRDVGEINGLPYLVMEFLRGLNLQEYRLQFKSLAFHEVLRIAIETVDGLWAVHRAGLIHRDLKPDNIWIESPSLNVKLIDFGLVHGIAEEIRLTRTGSFIGTPAFMAPEQASGQSIDHRIDFFSLGCILYDLVVGTRPFERGNVISTLSALANYAPPPPIEIVPEAPREFSDLIMRLLEKAPENRPHDCAEILEALRRILDSLS